MMPTHRTAGIPRAADEPEQVGTPRRALPWILTAFGSLAAGLVGGAILLGWEPEWVWTLPVTGFIGYVLAFRRGMLLWNPSIDGTWRLYFRIERDADDQPPSRGAEASSAEQLPTARRESERPPRPELKVIR